MTILDKIVASTRSRLEASKAAQKEQQLREAARGTNRGFAFEKALAAPSVTFICEVKKASPSKGVIAQQFPYTEIAQQYQQAGAGAISVLTEPDFFQGSLQYLSDIRKVVSVPLLRKDFIIDPYQIYETATSGADALLLICSILSEQQLKQFIETADGYGLSCLVEAHNETEINMALQAGARVIGVNNRNLHNFSVNLDNSLQLRKLVPPSVLFVAESGIQTAEDIAQLHKGKVDAVLVGETLMRAPDKTQALAALRGGTV